MISLAIFIFSCIVTNSIAQKNYALKNGFSITNTVGRPAYNYGLPDNMTVRDEVRIQTVVGMQIGNRWYIKPSEKFGVGILAHWFDFSLGTRDIPEYGTSRLVIDFSIGEVGPVATIALNRDIAFDAYYNLRPTFFYSTFTNIDSEHENSYDGVGITYKIGTAFRWKVLTFGVEYVFGKIHNSNDNITYSNTENIVVNNFRMNIGVKF